MESNSVLSGQWYYTVEIERSVFTKGYNHQNIALTRKLLRNVLVKDKACIDIGTQEAVIPVLLRKAGAGAVVAYDRFDLSERIGLLRDVYHVDFEYVAGMQLQELPGILDAKPTGRFFDLVVFPAFFIT